MGWAPIAYVAFVTPFALRDILGRKPPLLGEFLGFLIMVTCTLLFFTAMIQTAARLPNDFAKLYRRARWLGILAGSFGCPILTLPAFVAVSRLAKYRNLTSISGLATDT
jgi:hypothetical protein